MAILTVLILLILEKKPSLLVVPQLSHMWMGPVFLAFLPFCLHSGKPRSRYAVNSTGEHAEDQDGDPRYGLCSCFMGTGPLSAQTFSPPQEPHSSSPLGGCFRQTDMGLWHPSLAFFVIRFCDPAVGCVVGGTGWRLDGAMSLQDVYLP